MLSPEIRHGHCVQSLRGYLESEGFPLGDLDIFLQLYTILSGNACDFFGLLLLWKIGCTDSA